MRILAALSICIILLSSCESTKTDLLPRYSGDPGEVIIVVDEALWEGPLGDTLYHLFTSPLKGLPQDESMFTPIQIAPENFTKLFKTHRNVFKISKELADERNSVTIKPSAYAKDQLLINVRGADEATLVQTIVDEGESLLWFLHNAEIKRIMQRNAKFGSAILNNQVLEKTGVEITTMQDMVIAKETNDFLWLRLDRQKPLGGYQHQISQGILIYSRPYTDTAQFNYQSLIDWKNEINKTYVQGPQDSTYMTVSNKLYAPIENAINWNDARASELRGLWRMENYFMGGPFYLLSFYNQGNGKQYVVEGYAFAPQFDKAPLLREIEAVVKSVQIPEEKASAK